MDQQPAASTNKSFSLLWLIIMGLVLGLIIFLGILTAELIGRDSPLSVALACEGIAAFLFLLKIQQQDSASPLISETSMRSAIAGALVIEYLVLLATVAFFRESPEQLNPLTQTMVNNFTTLVGIVIAFYFGSSAYAQVKQSNKD